MSNQLSGVAIAAAAAALFAAGSIVAPTVNAAEGGMVHCAGVNSCKGQGWVSKASAKECTDAGGKVVK